MNPFGFCNFMTNKNELKERYHEFNIAKDFFYLIFVKQSLLNFWPLLVDFPFRKSATFKQTWHPCVTNFTCKYSIYTCKHCRSNDKQRMKDLASILSGFKSYNACVDAFIEQQVQLKIQNHKRGGGDLFKETVPLCENSWKVGWIHLHITLYCIFWSRKLIKGSINHRTLTINNRGFYCFQTLL